MNRLARFSNSDLHCQAAKLLHSAKMQQFLFSVYVLSTGLYRGTFSFSFKEYASGFHECNLGISEKWQVKQQSQQCYYSMSQNLTQDCWGFLSEITFFLVVEVNFYSYFPKQWNFELWFFIYSGRIWTIFALNAVTAFASMCPSYFKMLNCNVRLKVRTFSNCYTSKNLWFFLVDLDIFALLTV